MRENALLEVLRATDLRINRALFVKLDERWGFETMGAPHSRLYFVTAGSGFIKTESQYVELIPGNVYFVPSNCAFSCGCEHLEKLFFHVSISTIERYDLFFNLGKIYSLPFSANEIEILLKLIDSESYIDIIALKSEIMKILIKFNSTYSFEKTAIKKYSKLIQAAIAYIESNTSVKIKISDISKALFISESKIRNTFKNEMNMPIGKYIDDMIFIKARQLLSDPKYTIAAVSAELGFCDQFYFSRRFKEKFGFTPSEFRKSNKIY